MSFSLFQAFNAGAAGVMGAAAAVALKAQHQPVLAVVDAALGVLCVIKAGMQDRKPSP